MGSRFFARAIHHGHPYLECRLSVCLAKKSRLSRDKGGLDEVNGDKKRRSGNTWQRIGREVSPTDHMLWLRRSFAFSLAKRNSNSQRVFRSDQRISNTLYLKRTTFGATQLEGYYGLEAPGNMDGIPAKKNVIIENWASTFRCAPEHYVEPENLEQLQEVLKFARENQRAVKVVGRTHSPSDIAMTSDIMVDVKRLNKVINVNKEAMQVTVEAGILLADLNTVLEKNGLALSVLPSLSDFTVGGCMSCGVHGSGIKFGALSSYVRDIEVMSSDGELHYCSETVDPDLFHAASCGLGAIGILTKVTIQCEPAFNLVQRQFGETLDETLNKLDMYLSTSEHFKFEWYPHTEKTLVYLIDRAATREKPRTRNYLISPSWWKKAIKRFWDQYGLEFLYFISYYIPMMTICINKFAHWLHKTPVEFEDVSYNVFNFDCLFKQYVNDWAVPLGNTRKAILELKEFIDKAPGRITAHFPVEVRFCKADNAFMTPSSGRDCTFINIIMFRPYGRDIEKELYWNAYEDIMERLGGRPHWAKEHRVTATKLRRMFPNFEKWCEVRRRVDPNGLFLNNYLKRMLEM